MTTKEQLKRKKIWRRWPQQQFKYCQTLQVFGESKVCRTVKLHGSASSFHIL